MHHVIMLHVTGRSALDFSVSVEARNSATFYATLSPRYDNSTSGATYVATLKGEGLPDLVAGGVTSLEAALKLGHLVRNHLEALEFDLRDPPAPQVCTPPTEENSIRYLALSERMHGVLLDALGFVYEEHEAGDEFEKDLTELREVCKHASIKPCDTAAVVRKLAGEITCSPHIDVFEADDPPTAMYEWLKARADEIEKSKTA
jgi:hypothetical protein